eukprot:TRINITY_DN14288_c0_g1_i2.p1 TRINITY_DN14288_c0_g1~~TRINITY_DN14288_c0_g1_i2.p1  ORF type:complete len:114 (+),score=22.47 TRINITY_DN14288_c0_g1_i2:78-419(+)
MAASLVASTASKRLGARFSVAAAPALRAGASRRALSETVGSSTEATGAAARNAAASAAPPVPQDSIKQALRGPLPVVAAFGAAYWYMNQPRDANGNLKMHSVTITIFGPNVGF